MPTAGVRRDTQSRSPHYGHTPFPLSRSRRVAAADRLPDCSGELHRGAPLREPMPMVHRQTRPDYRVPAGFGRRGWAAGAGTAGKAGAEEATAGPQPGPAAAGQPGGRAAVHPRPRDQQRGRAGDAPPQGPAEDLRQLPQRGRSPEPSGLRCPESPFGPEIPNRNLNSYMIKRMGSRRVPTWAITAWLTEIREPHPTATGDTSHRRPTYRSAKPSNPSETNREEPRPWPCGPFRRYLRRQPLSPGQ